MIAVYGAPVFMTGAGVVQSASAIGFETLYAGYRWDNPAPQMYYVRNRFLLPQVGTWNRRDPLGYVDGMALYEYVVVINSVDPSGLSMLGNPTQEASTTAKGNYYSAKELKKGTFVVNMQTRTGRDENRKPKSGLEGTIEFTPNLNCDECKEIKLVQTVKFQVFRNNQWVPYPWTQDGLRELNSWRTRQSEDGKVHGGYHIDVRGDCEKSIFYRDCTSNDKHSHNGTTIKGNPLRSASLHDTPKWHTTEQYYMRFETCAVCADDLGAMKSFGCVHWGFDVKDSRTTPSEVVAREEMSPTMIEAIRIYNESVKD